MLNAEHRSGVVNGAIAVVVIADGAVEKVVLQNAVERIQLRVSHTGRLGDNDRAFR